MRTLIGVCLAVFLVLGTVGCGGPEGGRAPSRSASVQVRQISTKDLPKLSSPIAPVDGGRLKIAPPQNWHVPPRRAQWLVRFQADPGIPYPMIFVTVEDSDATHHVTRDNLEEFAAEVRRALLAGPDTARLAAGLQPVTVGDFHGALYRRWGKSSGRVMERWMLETVANGRRYTLELRSREGLAETHLPHLYAVASGLKFSKGEDAGAPLPPIEEAPDDETTEEEPEDDADEDDVDAP